MEDEMKRARPTPTPQFFSAHHGSRSDTRGADRTARKCGAHRSVLISATPTHSAPILKLWTEADRSMQMSTPSSSSPRNPPTTRLGAQKQRTRGGASTMPKWGEQRAHVALERVLSWCVDRAR